MTQLWILPVDERSFQQTLTEPIDVNNAPNKPVKFPDQARVWGVRTDPEQGSWERNKRNLERMKTGDPLLVYRNSTSEYHAMGRIGPFWHTTYIRDEFWNGGPAIDIFAVEDYEEINISRKEVNQTLGYKENFWPQGLWRVADDRPVDSLLWKLSGKGSR